MMNRYSNARHARAPMLASGAFLLKSLISFGAYLSPEADAVIERGREPRMDSCQKGECNGQIERKESSISERDIRETCYL